jgi:hypothetical protein
MINIKKMILVVTYKEKFGINTRINPTIINNLMISFAPSIEFDSLPNKVFSLIDEPLKKLKKLPYTYLFLLKNPAMENEL